MRTKLLFVGVVVGVFLAGCDRSELPAEFTDRDAVVEAVTTLDSIAQYSESERYALDDDGPKLPEYQEGDGFGKVGEAQYPITPLRWGRRITSVNREVTIDIQGDTIAIATITRTFAGNLIIIAIRDSGGVADTVQVTKPFSDIVKRKVLFIRVGRFENRRQNWRPVAVSLVEGKSPVENFLITELRITTPRDTVVVTDPLNTWLRFGRLPREIPRIRPGDSVQIRVMVSSQNDSSEIVVLRWGVGWGDGRWDGRRHRARIPMISQSGGTGNYTRVYERTFIAHRYHRYPARFNAVIDALSYNTLFDDVAPYSNKFWGAPYVLTLF